jgi:DNA-binding MarR family transcriptional regulator
MKRRPGKLSGLMTPIPTRCEHEIQALIAARALIDRMTALYRDLEKTTGAPIAVHRALASIGAEPGIPASKLALQLGIQRPGVSHVLKSLAARGWVERVRSDADQRSVRLYPTPAGQSILDATSGRAAGTLQHCIRQLSDAELDGFSHGLGAMLKHLPPPSSKPRQPAAKRAGARAGSNRALRRTERVASG